MVLQSGGIGLYKLESSLELTNFQVWMFGILTLMTIHKVNYF